MKHVAAFLSALALGSILAPAPGVGVATWADAGAGSIASLTATSVTVSAAGQIAAPSMVLGTNGTALTGLAHYVTGVAPPAIPPNSCEDVYFDAGAPLPLANLGDECMTGDLAAQTANVSVRCRVVATGIVYLRFCNPTGGNPTPAAGTYSVLVANP